MRLSRFLRRFRADETGSILIEGILVLPIMAWVSFGVFVFFDGYHAQAMNVKVAYTIGDAMSRESEVTPEYFDSLYDLQGVLAQTEEDHRMRLTAVRYTEQTDRYDVVWSHTRGGGQPMTNAALQGLLSQVPVVADQGVLLVTETWVDYVPVFDVGIEPFTFHDFVVTDPRFTSQLCYNTVNQNGSLNTATC